jgi:hypothetical protein
MEELMGVLIFLKWQINKFYFSFQNKIYYNTIHKLYMCMFFSIFLITLKYNISLLKIILYEKHKLTEYRYTWSNESH